MKKFFILLIILLSLLVTLPFFKSGYFPTHDGQWAVVRLGAMHRAVLDRHFPARWSGNQNFTYGYPLFEFTYPFPYYLGEVLKLAKFSLVFSVKLIFVISVLISGIAMFLFSREIFGNFGGLISSVFYMFAPYRLVNLYVRGSIGESLSLALFPILFFALFKLYKNNNANYTILFSLFFAILLTTHNITALIFTPFLIVFSIYLLIQKKDKKNFGFHLLFGFIFGVLLSSFFLLPALLEKKYIALSQVRISDIDKYFVTLNKLINSPWNYGAYGTSDSFSVQIGRVHLVALLFSIVGLYLQRNKKLLVQISLFSLISLIVLVFFMLPQSIFFWENVPLLSNVDFPWRLLTPLIFFLSIFVGALSAKKMWIVGAILIAAVVYFNHPYAHPKSYADIPDSYYFTNEATTTSNDELMPIWVKEKPKERPKEKVEVMFGKANVTLLRTNSVSSAFEVDATTPSKIAINTIYFPGWELKSNGKTIPFTYNNPKGIMVLALDPGKYIIDTKFQETPLRIFSDALSILGLIGLLLFWKFKPLR